MRIKTSLSSGKMEGKIKPKNSIIIKMESRLKVDPFNNVEETRKNQSMNKVQICHLRTYLTRLVGLKEVKTQTINMTLNLKGPP